MLASQLDAYGVRSLALESAAVDQMADDKHLVLLYPIHGFNAPRNVKRFARCLPPALYETVSLVGVGCTTGWVNQAASSDLRKLLGNKGYPIIVDYGAKPLFSIVSDIWGRLVRSLVVPETVRLNFIYIKRVILEHYAVAGFCLAGGHVSIDDILLHSPRSSGQR